MDLGETVLENLIWTVSAQCEQERKDIQLYDKWSILDILRDINISNVYNCSSVSATKVLLLRTSVLKHKVFRN
jgi:hypothetical protein